MPLSPDPDRHGVSGLIPSKCAVGDRIELITETEHWIVDKLSPESYWLSLLGSNAGTSRITPIGTWTGFKDDGYLWPDWIKEKGEFRFRNHRTEADEALLVVLLVWKKNYHLPEAPSALEGFPRENT